MIALKMAENDNSNSDDSVTSLPNGFDELENEIDQQLFDAVLVGEQNVSKVGLQIFANYSRYEGEAGLQSYSIALLKNLPLSRRVKALSHAFKLKDAEGNSCLNFKKMLK